MGQRCQKFGKWFHAIFLLEQSVWYNHSMLINQETIIATLPGVLGIRPAFGLTSRWENALHGNTKIQGQVGLHVIVQLGSPHTRNSRHRYSIHRWWVYSWWYCLSTRAGVKNTALPGRETSNATNAKILKVDLEWIFKNAFLLNVQKYPNFAIPTDVPEIVSVEVFRISYVYYIWTHHFSIDNDSPRSKRWFGSQYRVVRFLSRLCTVDLSTYGRLNVFTKKTAICARVTSASGQ